MREDILQQLIAKQRWFIDSGSTRTLEFRLAALDRLRAALERHEEEVYAALRADLGKSRDESYMCEVGMVYSELSYMRRHLKGFMKRRRVTTPLAQFPSRSWVEPCPRGVVLIMSPWNYPLMLTLDPLVDALAAGNTAIVKPSAYAPATAAVLGTILQEAFDSELVAVVTGGRQENQQLLKQEFDYIFFTGSQAVGREVLRCAAEHLTPVSLELGGKSPCIVDNTANLTLAARRIVFGKFLNCGQTCVAPDYLLCDESIAAPLTEAIQTEIRRQFGDRPLENPAYGRIISQRHFQRIAGILEASPILFGGRTDPEALRIEPTLLGPCDWSSRAMEEELFAPLLPILTYRSLEDALAEINARPHPLALYFFSEDRAAAHRVMSQCTFGGGCVNDTIIHLATPYMGFGGVGASGMGAYHGKAGFDAFSHRKSIVRKSTRLDLPMRYQPYTQRNGKLVKFFLK